MKRTYSKSAFTLLELLLVIAVLAILSLATGPIWSEAAMSINDGTAEQMVNGLVSNTRSMAIAGRTNERSITFYSDGTIKIGSNTYQLPSNFTFEEKKTFVFDLKGQCTPSGQSVTIKRNGYSKSITIN